jgi:hypothetical protein
MCDCSARYWLSIVGSEGGIHGIAVDFAADEPVDVQSGNLESKTPADRTDDYFLIRTISRHALLFFPFDTSRSDYPLRPMPTTPIDCIGSSRDLVFLSSGLSVHILSLDHNTHNFHPRFELTVESPVLQFFACTQADVLCYIFTNHYEIYLCTTNTPQPSVRKFRHPVLRADCLRECLAVLTKDRRLYTISNSASFDQPTEVSNVDQRAQNGPIPARMHRVAKESVLFEFKPGVLFVSGKEPFEIDLAICCKRSALKWATRDRHCIIMKKSRGSAENLRLFETSRQIVAFDELIASRDLVVIERETPIAIRSRLFQSFEGSQALSLLAELDPTTGEFPCALEHPLDCQLLFSGVSTLAGPFPKEQLIHILAMIGANVDPLLFTAFTDLSFFTWALGQDAGPITNALTYARLAEIAALVVMHCPFHPERNCQDSFVFPDGPIRSILPIQLDEVFVHGFHSLDSLRPEDVERTLEALLQFYDFVRRDVAHFAVKCVNHYGLVPKMEPLIDLLMRTSSYCTPDLLMEIALLTLRIYPLEQMKPPMKAKIVDFRANRDTEVLDRAFSKFFFEDMGDAIREVIRLGMLLPEPYLFEHVMQFFAKHIPFFVGTADVIAQVREGLDTFVQALEAAGSTLTHASQRVTYWQGVRNSILLRRIADTE